MKKVGHYVSKAGEFVAKYTYDPVVNLFSKWFGKKGAEAAGEAAERILAQTMRNFYKS